MNKPLVVVFTFVYNHEPYLHDYFQGIIMQKTNFPFVAIVHDDCSTDNSAAVIREYAEKYPDIIKPIYETENQFSKPDDSILRIMRDAIDASGAKYVAECEGDDYWTDPYKLQKQVDFLESHSDYSLCFSRVKCLRMATGQLEDELIVRDMPGESTIEDLAKGNYIHTPSTLYRYNREVYDKFISMGNCLPGDYVMWMLLAEKGKLWKMEEPMAVYRVGSGIWSGDQTIKSDIEMLMTLNRLWIAINNTQVKQILQKQIMRHKDKLMDIFAHQQKDIYTLSSSKAYRIGKALLAPFKWLKK